MQSEMWNQGNTGEGQTLKDPEFWFNVLRAGASCLELCVAVSTAELCLTVACKYYSGIRFQQW